MLNKIYNQKSILFNKASKESMKHKTSKIISGPLEKTNTNKCSLQNHVQDPLELQNLTESLTEMMKVSGKKRVPFIEILNQEEREIQKHKVLNKSVFSTISKQNKEQILSNHNNSKSKIKATKNNENLFNQIIKSDPYTDFGQKSLQLVSVIENVHINNKINTSSMEEQRTYRLQINQQAINMLLELNYHDYQNKDFTFCTAVGKTKTGKSFLLNKLLNSSQKSQNPTFSVNHTLASCTKGIWISKQPISITKKGSSKSIFILDTAGFGSYDSSQQVDYKLLILSILLSDVLMYNSIGPIDEHMLNGMSLAVEISKMICQQQQKSKSLNKMFSFPALLWILRDFSLELLTKQNHQISEQQYLQRCLQVQNDMKNKTDHKAKSKVNIREAIKSIFTQRKCSTLVFPFDEDGKVVRYQFTQGLMKIKNKLIDLANSSKKNIQQNSNPNKVEDFILKLRAFVQLLNCQKSFNPSNKKSFSFPKIQLLETNLNRIKLLHEFKKVNDHYQKLFQKYEQNIQKIQETVDCKQKYLKKVQKLRQNMEQQIHQARIQFKEKIQKLLNLKKSHSNLKIQDSTQNKSSIEIDQFNIEGDVQQFSSIINVVKQNLKTQRNNLKLRFEQIEQKIIQTSQSYRYQQNIQNIDQTLANKIVQQKINCFKQISSISDLKRAFETAVKDLTNFFKESLQQYQIKNLQKQLEVGYLQHKVTLMQSSHLQLSNQSNFDDYLKIQKPGYESSINCQKSFYIPYLIIPSSSFLKLKFLKTIVKQMHHQYKQESQKKTQQFCLGDQICQIKKMKLQFIIEVELNNKKWFIRRKLKDFIELNNIISIMFTHQDDHLIYPNTKMDQTSKNSYHESMLKLSSLMTSNDFSEQKVRKIKKQLESFLIKLNNLDYVRNSRIFQKFVKINKQYLDL